MNLDAIVSGLLLVAAFYVVFLLFLAVFLVIEALRASGAAEGGAD